MTGGFAFLRTAHSVTQKYTHEYDIEGSRQIISNKEVVPMSRGFAGFFDNCTILFFIILFLLLFFDRGFVGARVTNEVE